VISVDCSRKAPLLHQNNLTCTNSRSADKA
jgi:hypothetical protein